MNNEIRDRIMAMVMAESESNGAGWVQPYDINAHINSYMGSDAWQVDTHANIAALNRVYDRLMESYMNRRSQLSSGVEVAVDYFERVCSLEALVDLAVVMMTESS